MGARLVLGGPRPRSALAKAAALALTFALTALAADHRSPPPNQNYNSCHPRPIRIMVHDPASPPPASRDTEGRACRKPKISRTNAINKSGLRTEKGANKALRTGQGM